MAEKVIKDDDGLIVFSGDEALETRRPVRRNGRKSLYMAAVIAAGGGFVTGFDTGAVSGTMILQPFIDRFLSVDGTYRESLITAMMLLTATIAGVSSGYICDSIGRKNTILLGTVLFAIGALFETIGHNFGLFLTGRLIVGFGEGFLCNGIPLYHSEIAPPDIRGRLITLYSTMSAFGTIIGYFVNFGTSYLTNDWSWRTCFLIQLFACILLLGAYWLPYSPRWLIDKGRREEALEVLAKLHESSVDDPEVRNEFLCLCDEIEQEHAFGARSFIECFRGTNLKRTLFALFIGWGAAFTGTYSINYYAPQIFLQAGVGGVSLSLATTGASNILTLIVSVITLGIVDRLTRRGIFGSGAAICGVSMYIVAALFQAYCYTDAEGNVGLTNAGARGVCIALIFVFQATYAYSWGPVAFIYPAEIANTRTRAKVCALAFGVNWAVGIFFTFVTPILMDRTIYGGYYFFAACCTVLFIGSMFLPETKGKTLEEIDRMFNPE